MSNELPDNILPQIIDDNRRDITVATFARWVGRLDRFSTDRHRRHVDAAYGSRPINIPQLPPDFARRTPLEGEREDAGLLISIYCAFHASALEAPRNRGKCFFHAAKIFPLRNGAWNFYAGRSARRRKYVYKLVNITNAWMLNARYIAGE